MNGMRIPYLGRWIAALVALALLAGVGFAVYKKIEEQKKQEAKKEAEAKLPKLVELTESDLITVTSKSVAPMLTLNGTLEASAQGVAKARAAGTLMGASKREGDTVKAGEVLATIDAADLRMRLAQQESLRAQTAAQFETNKKNRAAQQNLLDKGFISQNAFDATDGSYQASKAALDAAQSQVNLAAQSLRDTSVVAPIAGVISKRHIEPGERATPESTVYTIMQTTTLEFAPQVPAEEASKLKIGMPIAVTVPGVAEPVTATLTRIAPSANAGTRTVDMRAKLPNPDGLLKAGVSATGVVPLAAPSAAIVIPLDVLRSADVGPHIFTVVGTQAKRVPVTLGARDERRGTIVITGGVKEGDRALLARVQDVKDGQGVRFATSAAPSQPAAATPAAPAASKL
jgi:membrane fusion protein, multidrug efflux system